MKLFHVSSQYLGEQVTLEPRIPPGQSLAELHSQYKLVKRIACSDTIEKCLIGITKLKLKEIMYVYKPIGRYRIDWDSPRNACDDWELTDECWILEPTQFQFLYAIKCDTDIMNSDIKYTRMKSNEVPAI